MFGPIRALDMPSSPEVRDMSIEVEVSGALKLGLGYLIRLVRHIKVIKVIQFDFNGRFPLRGKDDFRVGHELPWRGYLDGCFIVTTIDCCPFISQNEGHARLHFCHYGCP